MMMVIVMVTVMIAEMKIMVCVWVVMCVRVYLHLFVCVIFM